MRGPTPEPGTSFGRFVGARLLRDARTSVALVGALIIGFGLVGIVVVAFDGKDPNRSGGLLAFSAVVVLGVGLLAAARGLGKLGRRIEGDG